MMWVILQSDLPALPTTLYGLLALIFLGLVWVIIKPLLEGRNKEHQEDRSRLFKMVDDVSANNTKVATAVERAMQSVENHQQRHEETLDEILAHLEDLRRSRPSP